MPCISPRDINKTVVDKEFKCDSMVHNSKENNYKGSTDSAAGCAQTFTGTLNKKEI